MNSRQSLHSSIISGFARVVLLMVTGVILFAFSVLAVYYITCPVYFFQEPIPFSGNRIHNVYENLEGIQWLKGNFQVQSRAWGGLTDGRKNTNEAILEVYRKLGYQIIVTSDYQKINRYREGAEDYIPTYEHGYGIYKTHQVCIGSRRVMWRDYPIFPGLSNKQHVIECLRDDNEVVVLAHPGLRDGYVGWELNYIRGYHMMEVLNRARESLAHWDIALSGGYPAFIMANDDAHDISHPEEVGRYATMIGTASSKAADVIEALKSGRTFGIRIFMPEGETFAEKEKKAHQLPGLVYCKVSGDTLKVQVSDTASEFRFIGQGGQIREIDRNMLQGEYILRDTDTYIRTEIEFPDRNVFFLNPVFRQSRDSLGYPPIPEINTTASRNHKRIWGSLSLIGIAFLSGWLIRQYFIPKKHEK